MLDRLTSREITEYQAYERVAGPIGPARADVQAAIVAATVANANRGKGKPATPADFIPTWEREPEQTVDEMVSIAYALNSAFGGTVEGGDDGASE